MDVATLPRPLESPVLKKQQLTILPATGVAIQDALNRTGHGELRRIDLACVGDAVTITGRVPTYYLKQLVQCVALSAPGVGRVNNELHVC